MVLSELRALLTDLLAYDLDNYQGESPSDVELNAQINWALRALSKELFLFDPKVDFKLTTGEPRYRLDSRKVVSKRVVRPLYVTIDGNKLWNAQSDGYGMWGWEEFIGQHPTWEAATNGTPTKAVSYGAREIIIHIPPTATIAAQADNYIAGQVLANDLTGIGVLDDPSDQGIPAEVHESIAYLAAIYAATPNVTEQEGYARLAAYDKSWRASVKAIRNENHRLFHSGTTRHGLSPDYLAL